jgi:hypothetical protein
LPKAWRCVIRSESGSWRCESADRSGRAKDGCRHRPPGPFSFQSIELLGGGPEAGRRCTASAPAGPRHGTAAGLRLRRAELQPVRAPVEYQVRADLPRAPSAEFRGASRSVAGTILDSLSRDGTAVRLRSGRCRFGVAPYADMVETDLKPAAGHSPAAFYAKRGAPPSLRPIRVHRHWSRPALRVERHEGELRLGDLGLEVNSESRARRQGET